MPDTQSLPTFSDLMAKTGYFVLHWSSFELTLQETILEVQCLLGREPISVGGGLKDRLDLWVDLVTRLPENTARTTIARVSLRSSSQTA